MAGTPKRTPPKYSLHTLPGNIKQRNVRLRKKKKELIESQLPRWCSNPNTLQRVLHTYELYNKRVSIPAIMQEQRLSVKGVYDDIHHAREFAVIKFTEDLRHCIMEQVEARKLLVAEARQSIEELKAGERVASGGPRRRNTIVTEDGEIRSLGRDDGADREGRIGPLAANAIAQLYKVIAENEKAIEELLMLRSRSGSVETSPFNKLLNSGALPANGGQEPAGLLPAPSEPGEPAGRKTYTVIDARTFDVDEGITAIGGNSASGTIGDEFVEQGRADGRKVQIIEGEYS